MSITDLRPYTFHRIKRGKLFKGAVHHICYEGRMVREVRGLSIEDLDNIVFLLNAAYQLGFSDGSVSR